MTREGRPHYGPLILNTLWAHFIGEVYATTCLFIWVYFLDMCVKILSYENLLILLLLALPTKARILCLDSL